tara:strand:- start:1571 stop:2329 length:759 start_codon:yes stop_codon:yes gene_type:complete
MNTVGSEEGSQDNSSYIVQRPLVYQEGDDDETYCVGGYRYINSFPREWAENHFEELTGPECMNCQEYACLKTPRGLVFQGYCYGCAQLYNGNRGLGYLEPMVALDVIKYPMHQGVIYDGELFKPDWLDEYGGSFGPSSGCGLCVKFGFKKLDNQDVFVFEGYCPACTLGTYTVAGKFPLNLDVVSRFNADRETVYNICQEEMMAGMDEDMEDGPIDPGMFGRGMGMNMETDTTPSIEFDHEIIQSVSDDNDM